MSPREFGPADHHPAEYAALTDWLAARPDADRPDPDDYRD